MGAGHRITMALAGFSPDEIELVQKENTLFVAGHKSAAPQEAQPAAEVLHRGIATRPFRHSFNLAAHVKVTDAAFQNGLLVIGLKREIPEAFKPRRIEIASASGQQSNVTTLERSNAA
jgi:molecular chaperone IbpA